MNHSVIDQGNGIFTIDTGYQRSGLVASHLIKQDDEVAFVDVGAGSTIQAVYDMMQERGISFDQVRYVMVTHVHLDHAGAAGLLMQKCPKARLVVHPNGAKHMIDPSKLIAGATAVYGEEIFKSTFGEVIPIDAARVIEAPDGMSLTLSGRQLSFMDTPGHARHHYCVYDERSQGFFSGDTFGLSYRELDVDGRPFIFPTTTPVQFEPDALHASIDRMMAMQPQVMFLTHFGCISGLDKLADDMHELIDAFVQLAQQADPENRFQSIKQSMGALLLERLRQHGCSMSSQQLLSFIDFDLELNSQGLEVWLDRQEKIK